MALLPSSPSGGAVTYQAVTASDTYVNSGRSELHVKNAGGGACTVTLTATGSCNQGFSHNLIITVPAGSDRLIPAADIGRFGSTVTVTFSPTTSVTAAVLEP